MADHTSNWTDERVEALQKDWAAGYSASQIASRIGGTSRNAVIGKVSRLGLPGRNVATRAVRGTAAPKVKSFDRIDRNFRSGPLTGIAEFERAVLGSSITNRRGAFLNPKTTEPLPPVDTMPAQVSFNKLEDHHCRAIVAEHMPFNADAKIYCGERKVPGTSWCECHLRRYANAIVPKQNNFREASPAMREGARSSGKPHRVFA